MKDSFAKSNPLEQFHSLLLRVRLGHAGEQHRMHDIFQRAGNRDQIEGLRNVPNLVTPQPCELERIKRGDINFVDEDPAFVGLVESANHVEER